MGIIIAVKATDVFVTRCYAWTGSNHVTVSLDLGETQLTVDVAPEAVERFGMLLEKLRREYDIEARKLRPKEEEGGAVRRDEGDSPSYREAMKDAGRGHLLK